MSDPTRQADIEDIEINLVLEAIFQKYGYDFRNYARASLKRRLLHRLQLEKLDCLSEMVPRLLRDKELFERLLHDLSITVTEMFRDPDFFMALRRKVLPALKTYPFVNIWLAGCSTGEEAYSIAILLQEENFYERAQIYATDYNNISLQQAQEGIYPVEKMALNAKNYKIAGGRGELRQYFTEKYEFAKIHEDLKKNIIFAHHNLTTDRVFAEMHVILCRNVLIYFDKKLQNRVLQLFDESLCNRGFLGLGAKETLQFTSLEERYERVDEKTRNFRKKVNA